jgi:hypothetical protein
MKVYKFLFYLVIHSEAVSQSVPQRILNRGIFIILRVEKTRLFQCSSMTNIWFLRHLSTGQRRKKNSFFYKSKLASPACQVEFKHYFSNLFNIL